MGNYLVTTADGTLTVSPKAVTITADDGSKTYDGSALTASGFTPGALESGDTHTFTVVMTAGSTITNVGTQPNVIATVDGVAVTAGTATEVGNYTVTTVNGTLTVGKRSVTLTSADGEKVYDGTELTNDAVTVGGDGFVSGEGAAYTVTGSQTGVGSSANAFTYTLNDGTLADNYEISTTAGTLTVTSNTTAIVITSATNGWTYDGALHKDETYTVTYGGAAVAADSTGKVFTLPTGDTVTITATAAGVTGVADTADENNTYTYVLANAANYGSVTANTGTLTINPKSISGADVTLGDALTYNGSEQTQTVAGVVIDGLDATFTVSGNTATTVGTADYTLTVTGTGNFTGTQTATWNIGKAALTITAKDQTYSYNGSPRGEDNATYTDASVLNTKVTAEGLQGSDALTSITLNGQATDSGAHAETLVPSAAAIGGATANYEISYVGGTLTISENAMPLVITSDTQSWTYDGALHTAEIYTVTFDGALVEADDTGKVFILPVTGDTVMITATAAGVRDVADTAEGNNTYTYEITNAADYSDVTANFGTLTVTQRALTIKAANSAKVYDGTALTKDGYSITEGTLAEGDSIRSVTVTGSRTETGSGDNVPSDAVILRGETDVTADYAVTYVNGTLTVDEPYVPETEPEQTAESETGTESEAATEVKPEPEIVTIPVSGEEESVDVTVSVEEDTATITDADVDKVLEAEEVGTVTIDVAALDEEVAAIVIPGEMLGKIAVAVADEASSADGLEVKLPNGTVTFDADAVAAISGQAEGSDLTLHLDDVELTELTSEQQAAVEDLEVEVVLDAYLTANGERISDFEGGSATVRIPYALPEGRTAAGLVVWYVADDGTRTQVPATFDGENVVFAVSHFSNYVVTYDPLKANEPENPEEAACPKDDTCPISAFTDAAPTAWYHDGVHWALETGIMEGFGNGLFKPNDNTTRAMAAQILWKMAGKPAAEGEGIDFADVADGAWYADAVRWASCVGIITGWTEKATGNLVFHPKDDVTREQFAAMLYRYAKLNGEGFVGTWMFLLDYPDAADVSSWADEAMHWMVMKGVVNGMGGKLNPQGYASRAQVATMICRFLNGAE